MGKPYSDDLRSRVVSSMASGWTCREAGQVFGVAPSTAGNWYRRYQRTSAYSALAMGGDHRSKLTAEASWISDRLSAVPELTLTEVCGDLADRGIEVSYASVWRTVKKLGLRFKKELSTPASRTASTLP
jgi:transposase